MGKHTPGPWELDGVEIRATASHPSESICVMTPGFEDADAQLLAAAPKLLAALEAMIEACAIGGTYLASCRRDAELAIAQAKGEQP